MIINLNFSIFLSFLAIAFIVWTIHNKIKTNEKKARLRHAKTVVQSPFVKIDQVMPVNDDNSNLKVVDFDNLEHEKQSPAVFIENNHDNDGLMPSAEAEKRSKEFNSEDFEKKNIKSNNKDNDLMSDGKDSASPERIILTATTEKKNGEQDADRSSVYVKILFNYIQILAILGNFPFNWPDALWGLFSDNKQAVSASQSFFSIDCFLKQDVFGKVGLRVFFTKLLLYALSPFGFLAISYIVWLLIFYAKYKSSMRNRKKEFQTKFITTLVVLLFMIHPNIIQQDFDSFAYFFF